MIKRICSLMLSLCMVIFSSCTNTDKEFDKSSMENAKPIVPKVTGTFIQPALCQNWSVEEWKAHYTSLLEADINMLIIQWVADTPYSKFKFAAYPSNCAEQNKTDDFAGSPQMLENALAAAEETGIKVWVGLNLSDEWWDNKFTSKDWRQSQANLGNTIAKETYELYKKKYPNAFYGWYWAWEFYNNTSHFENDWSDMMNIQLDYLTRLDKTMPILFSPFISKYIKTTPTQLATQ